MAFTLDTSTQGTYGTGNPFTVSHTSSTDADLLVAVLFVNGTTARAGGAPTYNSEALTDSGQGFAFDAGGEAGVEIWYLIGPSAGANSLSIPNTGALSMDASVMTFEASGTNTAAVDVANSASGTTQNPSLTLTSVGANALVIGGLGSGDRDVPTAGTNFTLVHTYDAGNQTWGSEYWLDAGATGNKTVAFGTARGDDWGLIGISFVEAAGATQYEQAAAGAITPTGAITKQTGKIASGALTPTGAIVRDTQVSQAGALTPTGATTKQTSKIFAGSLGLAGALDSAKIVLQAVAGALGLSGAITRQTGKVTDGTLTPAGGITKQTANVLTGVITPAGALIKSTLISAAGAIGLSGSATKQTDKPFTGALTPAGSLLKSAQKVLSGALGLAGSIASSKLSSLTIGGTLGLAGTITKQTSKAFTGAITFSGAVTKRIAKAFTGALTFLGTLLGVTPTVTPDCRTLSIQAENRTLAIEAENRVYAIEGLTHSDTYLPLYNVVNYGDYLYGLNSASPTERTLVIELENRTLAIEAENRTLSIECED